MAILNNGLAQFDALQQKANDAAGKKQTDSQRAASDYESFLMLMTTQMKNQDPLKPMDSTEFVSQLAQFSGVEQQVNMNKKLEELIKTVTSSQFDEAGLYLGKNISAPTGKFEVTDNAKPDITYKTPDNAVSSKIIIKDSLGTLVDSIEVTPSSSYKKISWDKLGIGDITASAGTYFAQVISSDSAGNQTTQNAITKNKVAEVTKTDTGYNLKTVNGDLVDVNDVISLSNI